MINIVGILNSNTSAQTLLARPDKILKNFAKSHDGREKYLVDLNVEMQCPSQSLRFSMTTAFEISRRMRLP